MRGVSSQAAGVIRPQPMCSVAAVVVLHYWECSHCTVLEVQCCTLHAGAWLLNAVTVLTSLSFVLPLPGQGLGRVVMASHTCTCSCCSCCVSIRPWLSLQVSCVHDPGKFLLLVDRCDGYWLGHCYLGELSQLSLRFERHLSGHSQCHASSALITHACTTRLQMACHVWNAFIFGVQCCIARVTLQCSSRHYRQGRQGPWELTQMYIHAAAWQRKVMDIEQPSGSIPRPSADKGCCPSDSV